MSARRSTLADLLSDVPDENRGIYRRLLSKVYRKSPPDRPSDDEVRHELLRDWFAGRS